MAAQFAMITYCDDPANSVKTNMPGWGIIWNGIETEDGNYAFIAYSPDNYFVLAIRGSLPPWDIFTSWDAFANWVLEDLDIITQVDWPYSYVPDALISSGMYRAFNSLTSMQDSYGSGHTITQYLLQYAAPTNAPIVIAGHSLGGAMSNVYASYLNWQLAQDGYAGNNANSFLYSFAAPAAGTQPFAQDLDNKFPGGQSFHFDIDNDIAPKFPVSLTVVLLAALYIPAPAADEIDVTYHGYTISLADALVGLGGILAYYEYEQPGNNYCILSYALSGLYTASTFDDWISEAAYQHSVDHYVSAVGGLPVLCTSSIE